MRSNPMTDRLSQVAANFPALTRRLAWLPWFLSARGGNLRIGIIHEDLHSLTDWDLDQATLPAHARLPRAV